MNTRKSLKKMVEFVTRPMRIFDDWTVDLDIDHDDLLGDLDPGWIEWRSSLDTPVSNPRIAA